LGKSAGQVPFDFQDGPTLGNSQKLLEEIRAGKECQRVGPGEWDLKVPANPVIVGKGGLGGRYPRAQNLDPKPFARWPRRETEMP
jgi:hypothetical protein